MTDSLCGYIFLHFYVSPYCSFLCVDVLWLNFILGLNIFVFSMIFLLYLNLFHIMIWLQCTFDFLGFLALALVKMKADISLGTELIFLRNNVYLAIKDNF